MRRPVGVKWILRWLRWTRFLVLPPSGHCRHASIRTLEERFVSLGAWWAFLVIAGAAICLAPCGSALFEWNPGQAINAVTETRLWAFCCSLPGTVLTLFCLFVLCRCRHGSLLA